MPRTYRYGAMARAINAVFQTLTRLGIGASYRHTLTVRGRSTGRLYSTPVDVMSQDGRRWLVAAYGVTNWVRNARAAGEVTLTRGGRSETVRIRELGVEDSVPVLRKYLREVPVTRPYFDAGPASPDDALAREVAHHPVFEITPVSPTTHDQGHSGGQSR